MTDERIIAYLLKELPEGDLERFEDECFSLESWPPEISVVEEDLVDAYLRNELPPEQRRHFEQNYLTTEARQERVRLAAALLRHADDYHAAAKTTAATAQTKRGRAEWFRAFWGGQALALRVGMAVLAAAIIIGVLWLFFIRRPTPQTFATLRLTVSANNRDQGNQAATVPFPIKEDALKISLELPDGFSPTARYRVVLMDTVGETKQLEVAEQDNQYIYVVIPRAQLKRGQYALQVFMKKDDAAEQSIGGSYLFTVK